MLFSLQNQFKRPRGLLGWIVGKIMEVDNRRINKWSLHQLHIQKGDHILEVGYGPGYCINEIIQYDSCTTIDGVDISSTMKEAAHQKNKKAVEKGRVRLFVHDISQFRIYDKYYDHIFSVNNYPLWTDVNKSLFHLHQMLKPGGTMLITVQPRGEEEKDSTARIYAEQISNELTCAGFKNIQISYKKFRPALTVSVKCTK